MDAAKNLAIAVKDLSQFKFVCLNCLKIPDCFLKD